MRSIGAWLRTLLGSAGNHPMMTEVKDLSGIELMLESSHKAPVLLLKHSTACPISAAGYRRVAEYLEEEGDAAPHCFLVKVIESRSVSNALSNQLGVKHQSPQLLLLDKGGCRWHASHGAIDGQAIRNALAQ